MNSLLNRFILLTWLTCLSAACVVVTSSRAVAQTQPPWKLAVVFSRDRGQRRYVGTVLSPALAERIAPSTHPGMDPVRCVSPSELSADYEVWLVREAETCGLWYSSSSRTSGRLIAGASAVVQSDDGSLARIVRDARPAGPQPPRIVQSIALAEWALGRMPSLEWLCNASTYIVMGRVVGNQREAHSPYNATWGEQHTTHVIAVERYLKAPAADLPPIVKVCSAGGTLVDRMEGVAGTRQGYEIDEAPPLDLGERYILFMKQEPDPSGRLRKLPYLTHTRDGFTGRAGELDELLFAAHWQDKILLRNGMTHAPRVRDDALDHWRFDSGLQILDVPENAAISAIQQVVGKPLK